MSPNQSRTTIFFAANGFVMTVLAIIGIAFYVYGSCIEPYVAGYVIRITKPDRIYRGYVIKKESGREVEVGCLRLHDLHKLASAVPLKYAFEVEARLSDKIPVSAYLADDHHFQSESDFTTHPVGQVWDRNYCFEMPGTIADNQAIRVSGHAEHARIVLGKRWPFWRSITPVPEVVILPTHCYRNDGSIETGFSDCSLP